ncbi:MAG TPA: C4-dicarboxylate ABC transporter permease [Candidatus Atribacteria bacterium]|nr:C4-dicarboxylate ABC transporter permease [Candidatus Atribacteria bacterium]
MNIFKKKKKNIDLQSEEVIKRPLAGNLKKLVTVLAISLSLFQLYTAAFGIYKTAIIHRAAHLIFILVLFFIIYPISKKNHQNKIGDIIDYLLVFISLFSVGYIVFFYEAVANRVMNLENLTKLDNFVGIIVILLVLEANRRSNRTFFFLMLLGLAYMLFGPYFPGLFAHPGISWERLIYLISYSSEGIFGIGLAVSSTYLYIFILFGVFLGKTGVIDFFIDLALSLVGKYSGGMAKSCVISSSLMGTITGSSLGSAAAVGSFTIPMMKKEGFKSHVAAAIEAISACGGQLMPPVMGAAAFIMAEIIGVPYGKIALAGLIPAVIYYINVFSIIHFESLSSGIKGLNKNKLPKFKDVVLSSGYLLLPLLVLIYTLMIAGYSATKSGFIAIICCIIVTYFRKENHFGWKNFLQSCEEGAYSVLKIAILCAGIGLIISSVTLTGLGMRFSSIAIALAGGNLFLLLFITMIMSLILGMGMPTPIVYLLTAIFIAPSMMQLGVSAFAAHFFVFYYAILSGLTPPVCLVAITTAAIAKADWFKTGLTATRFALAVFIAPYIWIFNPQLLMVGSWYEILLVFMLATMGVIAIASSLQGWFINKTSWIERIILFIAGLLVMNLKGGWLMVISGLLLVFIVVIYQLKNIKFKMNVRGDKNREYSTQNIEDCN